MSESVSAFESASHQHPEASEHKCFNKYFQLLSTSKSSVSTSKYLSHCLNGFSLSVSPRVNFSKYLTLSHTSIEPLSCSQRVRLCLPQNPPNSESTLQWVSLRITVCVSLSKCFDFQQVSPYCCWIAKCKCICLRNCFIKLLQHPELLKAQVLNSISSTVEHLSKVSAASASESSSTSALHQSRLYISILECFIKCIRVSLSINKCFRINLKWEIKYKQLSASEDWWGKPH